MTKNKNFSPNQQSAFDARFDAQKIVFGPVLFQCVHYAWKRGILQALAASGDEGRTVDELAETGRWSSYALTVVLESCMSAGVAYLKDGRYGLGKTGYCVLNDPMTKTNFDFIADICYRGLADLDAALDAQRPVGLKTLGDWSTLYQGIMALPEPARQSWFTFDHYYSDTSFPRILPTLFSSHPEKMLDVGANTGKFSLAALEHDPTVEMHLIDLPEQLTEAKRLLTERGVLDRARFHPIDLLSDNSPFPQGMDIVWMSQFLSCFAEDRIVDIFSRAADALNEEGQVIVLDTLWDRQRHDIAAYCLINTSPYFTAMANGNSRIYASDVYIRLAESTGLTLVSIEDDIGFCHSMLRFVRSAKTSETSA